MSPSPRILVVDDDRAVRTALRVNLSRHGLDVTLADRVQSALKHLREQGCDLVLTDVRMPDHTGLELLARMRESWPDVPVIIMTGYGSVTDAVEAMKLGAADYLIKPVERDELLVVVERALDHRALRAEVQALRREVNDRYGFENLIGTTPAMQKLYEEVAAVADTSATVLLTGPTGTGKELLASAVHYRSRRAEGPFVRVNCGAIPESLLESELFGHERGAFSGAVRQHQGTFERADGGTLLLDEIGEVSPAMQVKLLRVLQEGELTRVGGSSPLTVDVRLIAATNRELADEVRAGRFREDLYYRLNVIRIQVPPLRDRRADIPLLVGHFVRKYAEREDRTPPEIDPRCMAHLQAYDWPGNVRQLEHAVERALILSKSDPLWVDPPEDRSLSPEPAPETAAPSAAPRVVNGESLDDAIAKYEREIIIAALKENEGVQARAARQLGVSRSRLNYRIQKLDIQVSSIEYM